MESLGWFVNVYTDLCCYWCWLLGKKCLILCLMSKEHKISKGLHWIVLLEYNSGGTTNNSAFGDMSEAVHWSQFLLTCPLRTLNCEFELKIYWLDIQRSKRPSDCPQAPNGIPFLCLSCSFVYCTCPLVACCRLSTGWMLKCVWQNNIFDVACNLLIMPIKAIKLPSGRICI